MRRPGAFARFGVSLASVRALSALTASTMIAAGAAFVTQLLLARGLGPFDYGAIATALTTITLLSPIAGFGVGKLLLRVFGAEGWSGWRWLRSAVSLSLIASTAALVVLVAWAAASDVHPTIRLLTFVLAPTLAMYPLSELVYARLQVEERYDGLAIAQAIPNLVRMAVAGIAVALGATVEHTAIGLASALTLVAVAFSWFFARIRSHGLRLVGHGAPPPEYRLRAERASLRHVLGEAWPFALAGVFYLIYFQSDVILLGWLIGPEAAGIYNIAFAVMAAVYLLPSIVHQKYLLPKLHRWATFDRERFLAVFRFGNGTTLVLGLVVMTAVASLGPWAVPLVFGEPFGAAGGLLLLLSLAIPFRYVSTSVGAALVTHDHMRRKVWLMGATALVNLLLNLALIPAFTIYGAAAATVASEVVLMVAYLFAARRYVFGPDAWRGWTLRLALRPEPE